MTFVPCAKPLLVAPPLILIVFVAAFWFFDWLVPRWRPAWTCPFVHDEALGRRIADGLSGRRSRWPAVLLFLTILGFGGEVFDFWQTRYTVVHAVQTLTWLIATIAVAIKRPRTCPLLLLAFYIVCFSSELALICIPESYPPGVTAGHVSLVASATACLVICLMPFRAPEEVRSETAIVGATSSAASSSPEDNLRLWQFLTVSWMRPLIGVGKSRTLNEEDVWLLPFQFQHKRLHERFRELFGSVIVRLFRANGFDVLITMIISHIVLICNFSAPILLQKLLRAAENPDSPKHVTFVYAVLILGTQYLAAQANVLYTWYGRRCYERSRGEMIMMVYQKALSRKNVFFGEKISVNPVNQSRDGPIKPPGKRLWFSLPWKRVAERESPEDVKVKEAASMGKILNLIRGDIYEVAQRFWEVNRIVDLLIGVFVATFLVWEFLGPSCFLALVSFIIAQLINIVITKVLLSKERLRRQVTDSRLQITSQFVESIRHLRWYGWQNHWLEQVMTARDEELKLRIITSIWRGLLGFVASFSSGLFPIVALYGYTVLAGNPLSVDIIFPAMQLFSMLDIRLQMVPNIITMFINAAIALGRIEEFMTEPDKEATESSLSSTTPIELESCSYAWPGQANSVLMDLTIAIPQGLTVVCGKVGAGKSAFLQSLLGELDKIKGHSHVPNQITGYCSQTPWLQSMSIRDNILFSSPFDEQRYKKVLDACALGPDLANFKNGDLTFIGENGVGLSGGQKARVALARAVYSNAGVLLLDDPLSALDFHTAESIVRKCFFGQLMKDRIVVLVTHRTGLVRSGAYQVIEIIKGRAIVHGRDDLASLEAGGNDSVSPDESAEDVQIDDGKVVADKFLEEEHRAEWGVQAQVYWSYIKAGQLKWWALLVVCMAIYRLSHVGQNWFLKEWGEAYDQVIKSSYVLFAHVKSMQSSFFGWWKHPEEFFSHLPPPATDVRPWLWVFFAIMTFRTASFVVCILLMMMIVYFAGKTLFAQVMTKMSGATFRYLDVTPVGRLMNRLTSDISVVDGNISFEFQTIVLGAITWVTSVTVISSVTPTFLVFSLALTATFVYVFTQYLPCSQSLRRLEMTSLSPLISNFGELLHGLTTVRAFRAEPRFMARVIEVVDKFQGMDHFYWSLQSWMTFRFETLSAISTFVLTTLALLTNVSAGLMAFVLLAADNFVTSTHVLCSVYGALQMDFVSVERVDELRRVEQEQIGGIDPPASWPRYGADIVFEHVTVRYAPHLPPSLVDLNLRIPGGSSTAVIGRTGSGKSTLTLALLAAVRAEAEETDGNTVGEDRPLPPGRIMLDGLDISRVNTNTLRHRVTFVAQEPVLFPGSVRKNMDPVGDFTDAECAAVLARICAANEAEAGNSHRDMEEDDSHHPDHHQPNARGWTLETQIEAGGRNLSHGERQLIGLSRAVLRRSALVVLDEATASIDEDTAAVIQRVLRHELAESTVVTVAHRIEAIVDAKFEIVLEKGRMVRSGPVGERESE